MTKSAVTTKEMIGRAAFDLARQEGLAALSARAVAERLGCSTQPIYHSFGSMSALKEQTTAGLMDFMMEQITGYRQTGCAFLDSGLGYIHFAKTQKPLFRDFCLESWGHNIIQSEQGNRVIRELMEQELVGRPLSKEEKDKIFLQTMIFTYGMAVLAYLNNLLPSEDQTAQLLDDAFECYVEQIGRAHV